MPSQDKLLEVIQLQTDVAELGLDLGGVMNLVVQRTLALVSADGAAIELAELDDMVYRATSGIATASLGVRLKRSSSLSGHCVSTGQPVNCTDAENDPRVDWPACQGVGLRSMILVPLKHAGVTIGVLKAMSARTAHFSDKDLSCLGLLSGLVGASMYYATRYDSNDLFHKATHDGLTGLANRSMFMDRLRIAVAQSKRDLRPVGVMMIDMDGLKQINDSLGHRAGDAALVELARRLGSCSRQYDTVARLGGDEFGIVLAALIGPQAVETVERRLRDAIAAPFRFDEQDLVLSACVGTATCPADGHEIDRLIDLADSRMYQLKREAKAAALKASTSSPTP